MLDFIKQEENITYTEKGAVTLRTSGSACLDLFATIGALRKAKEKEVIVRFLRAYAENPDTAMKILFFARDIRGGLGERKVFRTILNWLAVNEPESVKKNLEYVAYVGRFDDLLCLLGTPCEKEMLELIRKQFAEDMSVVKESDKNISLLGKWLPSVNASNLKTKAQGKKIAKALGMTEEEYRKALVSLRKRIRIVENNLREKDYCFDYEKMPAKAIYKYKKAFVRNDTERYKEYLKAVRTGEKKLHAETLMPYELIDPYLDPCRNNCSFLKEISPEEKETLNATWESLPKLANDEDAIAVVDTSGSMYCTDNPKPAAVALSLGLYFAENNKGAFKNHFIEFSKNPKLIEIKGETFVDRLRYATSFCEVSITNLEAVFDLILNAAVNNKVPQEELPSKLVIISDMEFDCCIARADKTNFENARIKYEKNGYRLPQIVFWNVASRNRQQPVKINEQGVALVSGATPRLFSMVAGDDISPYTVMMEVLGSDRYAGIAA